MKPFVKAGDRRYTATVAGKLLTVTTSRRTRTRVRKVGIMSWQKSRDTYSHTIASAYVRTGDTVEHLSACLSAAEAMRLALLHAQGQPQRVLLTTTDGDLP